MTREGLPAEQLRVDLERMRSFGVAFDDAWEKAWGRIRWPHATPERRQWKAILEADREKWREAYDRRPAAHVAHAAIAAIALPA